MNKFALLLDRTAVLFLGVAAGAAIGFAFARGSGDEAPAPPVTIAAPEAAPIQGAPPAEAPPPPTAPAAPEAEPVKGAVAEPVATAPATPVPLSPELAQAAREGRLIRVGVFGDSFGDGVWSALYRLLPAKDGYKVTKYSQQSTGFTRYRRLNLEQHDAGQLADEQVDVAVISFGANDFQGVCDSGKCGALMSSYWQKVIGERVQSYVGMLRNHGAAVFWIGLPSMRDGEYDADAQAMDGFYRALMARLGVPFVDIRPLTVDGDGHYQAYYRDADGGQKLLRAGDGIHMSMNGYLRVTKGLAGQIRASLAAARTGQEDQ